ncbi:MULTISPECIES: RidA family protein [Galbibacter]|uniref:RidA family protein n=1 Tax=Galbibacter pacificus TaxID=2996052 RepID=A0ABT6FSM9_9FLAO|nr:RidA family protein [Galbibacter pacificus]MDG3582608.1 RidA family protein [Galbibacter pacificus]MDG3586273.1 RidA family protein [Galbibacter pacificus]
MIKPSEKIKELGLILPPAPKPAGVYRPVLVVDNFLYISGQGPVLPDGSLMSGRVGDDIDLEVGYKGARQVALTMLSTIQTHFGDIDRVKRVVKVLGMVNCTPDFKKHPLVINGFSELMAEIFGETHGIGVRSAVGMMLPDNIPAEIEAMFELHKE